ncbi:hypothetical protein N8H22_12330 [Stutzerimonas stutzeri]|uniref:hypothetical protein n=1 Tax=Stutzerimonas sp. S1 TaxID=3030652 RepID=UPI00222534B2|nr:hypothetical protein [Stutzerimonas sp. S1]MCW3149382.1 hypothetical protein [Stutzerimonas sp. S1]
MKLIPMALLTFAALLASGAHAAGETANSRSENGKEAMEESAHGGDYSGKGFGSAAQESATGKGGSTDTSGTGNDGSQAGEVDQGADGEVHGEQGTTGTAGEGGARGAY